MKEQLTTQANKNQVKNRELLLKQLTSLQFLLRQGLAIRRHKETEEFDAVVGIEKRRCTWSDHHGYRSNTIFHTKL